VRLLKRHLRKSRSLRRDEEEKKKAAAAKAKADIASIVKDEPTKPSNGAGSPSYRPSLFSPSKAISYLDAIRDNENLWATLDATANNSNLSATDRAVIRGRLSTLAGKFDARRRKYE
jgi:hypothetical protein